eukprot:TRINITY_DN3911_c0_g1_i1.p1 TRINITY_DN3911_c0_g1~~TRINITY_DN3911_c0_g1_i1.p1  ORF type:complete len:246 (-),score=37.19 TRINITY_DN3911_c0_g1_i1:251-988(-)
MSRMDRLTETTHDITKRIQETIIKEESEVDPFESSLFSDVNSHSFNFDENAQPIDISDFGRETARDIITDGDGYHLISLERRLATTNPNKQHWISSDSFLSGAWGMARSKDGTLYMSKDRSHVIGKLSPDFQYTVLAGRQNEQGYSDGIGEEATFSYPRCIAIDSKDNIYISDNGNHLIRKMTPDGKVTTLIGIPQVDDRPDSLYYPNGICVDHNDILYFCDSAKRVIRRYDTNNGHYSIISGVF